MQNFSRSGLPRAAVFGRSILWLLAVVACGCSQASPVPAAAAIAAKAVASAISAATQPAANPPATPAAAVAAVAAASNVVAPAGTPSIIGRWVLVNDKASPQNVCVVVFEHKAVFVTATRLNGQIPVVVTKGTYLATGSTLTTKIGPASRTMSYQFKGSRLILTDARLHRQFVYQRK